MSMTGVAVETESAGTYADVTEDELHRLVHLMGKGNIYVILQRSGHEGYAQSAWGEDGRYVVEYRGGPHDHWQAFTTDIDVVYEVLSGWATDRAGWRDRLDWSELDLGF